MFKDADPPNTIFCYLHLKIKTKENKTENSVLVLNAWLYGAFRQFRQYLELKCRSSLFSLVVHTEIKKKKACTIVRTQINWLESFHSNHFSSRKMGTHWLVENLISLAINRRCHFLLTVSIPWEVLLMASSITYISCSMLSSFVSILVVCCTSLSKAVAVAELLEPAQLISLWVPSAWTISFTSS